MNKLRVQLPEVWSYGDFKSDNYGVHTLAMSIPLPEEGTLCLWFSYRTIVAFSTAGRMVVMDAHHSRTTMRHMTWIDGGGKEAKKKRVPEETFNLLLASVLSGKPPGRISPEEAREYTLTAVRKIRV